MASNLLVPPRLPAFSQVGRTPQVLFDYSALEARVEFCAAAASRRGITLAYSVKTNPAPAVLKRMETAGLCAEAINGAEVRAALDSGFDLTRVVLGGPAKTWPTRTIPKGLLALLDDSLEDFHASVERFGEHRYHCLRLRFPGVSSRLGVDTEDVTQRYRVTEHLVQAREAGVAIGLATHQRSSFHSTVEQWLDTIRGLFEQLDHASPGILTGLDAIDLGGGFPAESLDALLVGDAGEDLLRFVHQGLPNCKSIILEPGRSLVEAYGFVIASVIAKMSDREITVDASFAELPWPAQDTRPVYVHRHGVWKRLPAGEGLLTGRTCAETDILARNVDVSLLHSGAIVCFAAAGAYDASMRNCFCTGRILEM